MRDVTDMTREERAEAFFGIYADRLPPRNYAADAIKLARLAEVFANAPANEIAPHLTVLAQASADLDAALAGLMK